MFETVTVDEALARGRKMINYPVLVIIVATIGLVIVYQIKYAAPNWVIGAAIPAALLLAYFYWSIMITRWRLWAFENVRNVHELKKRAIKEKLIWPDDSIFVRTEIRSSADRARWALLQDKFDRDDVFIDDFTVPAETRIYFSGWKVLGEFLLYAVCLAGGAYLLLKTDSYIIGGILVVLGLVLIYTSYKKIGNRDPQIIVNNEGMQADTLPFYSWDLIIGEDVITSRTGKNSTNYLVYRYVKDGKGPVEIVDESDIDDDELDYDDHEMIGSLRLDIDSLKISKHQLDQLLRVYRGRYQQKQNKAGSASRF